MTNFEYNYLPFTQEGAVKFSNGSIFVVLKMGLQRKWIYAAIFLVCALGLGLGLGLGPWPGSDPGPLPGPDGTLWASGSGHEQPPPYVAAENKAQNKKKKKKKPRNARQ